LDYNYCSRFSVNRWLKLVGVLLIAGIIVAIVSPDFDPLPTVARVSRATQRPHVVAFAAITATNKLWVQHSTPSPLAVLFRSSGNHPADLIDLNCTRLC
jgi:hypothetical protein